VRFIFLGAGGSGGSGGRNVCGITNCGGAGVNLRRLSSRIAGCCRKNDELVLIY